MQVLRESGHDGVTSRTVLACFLLQNGADIFTKNNKGSTPLHRLPIDEAAVVAAFFEQLKVRSVVSAGLII